MGSGDDDLGDRTAGGGTRPASVPAPGSLRLLCTLPLAFALFYLCWVLFARLGPRGDAARARQCARWDRRRAEREGPVMARIDYWTYAVMRERWPARTALSMLVLPFQAGIAAFRLAARFGAPGAGNGRPSVLAQALELWMLALRYPLVYGSEPGLYFLNRLYESERRGDAPFVFATLHQGVLAGLLNGAAAGSTDKGDFEARCAELGLPHVPVIARIEVDGRIAWRGDATALPADDLFSKPVKGSNGTGAARWLLQEDCRYRSERGELMEPAAVLHALRAAARRGPLVVQRRVRNHPRVEALVGATLATVRLVSILTTDGTFEPVLAIHRSAPRDAAVDNSSQGGVAIPIDLGSGVLGEASIIHGPAIEFSRTHPRTGAEIVGACLPFWPETLALVEAAHRAFRQHPVIGWDVGLTSDGPVLLEANTLTVVKSLQAAHRMALGRTPYAERLLELVEQRMDGRAARGRSHVTEAPGLRNPNLER